MLSSVHAWRRLAMTVIVLVASSACSWANDEKPDDGTTGRVAQALVDTDSDGMDDNWEISNFGSLSQTASGDFDADGMTNGEEHTYGFNPTVADAFDDADGDRYPNIFEVKNSSDPNSASSTPSSTYVVSGAGGGTHTTVGAAFSAVGGQSNNYPIIGIAAGVYSGSSNLNISLNTTKKVLVIGLEGASKTIIDNGAGWNIYSTSVLSSLTFQRMSSWALWISVGSSGESRLIDIRVKDSGGPTSYATAVHVNSAARTYVVGSTFVNNTGISCTAPVFLA